MARLQAHFYEKSDFLQRKIFEYKKKSQKHELYAIENKKTTENYADFSRESEFKLAWN